MPGVQGLQGECPVNVDMATYKAEFLSHYYGRRRPLHRLRVGLIHWWARLASRAPRAGQLRSAMRRSLARARASGSLASSQRARRAARSRARRSARWFARAAGPPRPPRHAARHPLARHVQQPFDPRSARPRSRCSRRPGSRRDPAQARSAAGGRCTTSGCSTRPSVRCAQIARRAARRRSSRRAGGRARAELRGGVPRRAAQAAAPRRGRPAARRRRRSCSTSSSSATAPDCEPPQLARKALVHGHCHHKRVIGPGGRARPARRAGLDAELLERRLLRHGRLVRLRGGEHYEVSMAVGERVLLPAVRAADGHADRRRRLLLPDADRRRHGPPRAPHRRGAAALGCKRSHEPAARHG